VENSEIRNGKVVIKEPGLECPVIVLSVVFWIIILLCWIGVR